ncbi:MAG: hypothetical protein GC190_19355 [Alphaproteobacteria bacterium]|nr:hypothetical protein [Alphaproteobacteria bacterium]
MRKTKVFKVTAENRDKDKTFLLIEWPASVTEEWGMRALMAVAQSGVQLPEGVMGSGVAGVAALGLQAVMRVNSAEIVQLVNELMSCVMALPSGEAKPDLARPLIEEDIEEVTTRLILKGQVFELLTGFSVADDTSKVLSAIRSLGSKNTQT